MREYDSLCRGKVALDNIVTMSIRQSQTSKLSMQCVAAELRPHSEFCKGS